MSLLTKQHRSRRPNTEIQNAVISMMKSDKNMLFVTLTMKQSIYDEETRSFRRLDEMTASQNLRHFHNLLNRAVLPASAVKRHNRKLAMFPVLENSGSDRLHYHILIEVPESLSKEFFYAQIISCWQKTNFADREIDIKEIYDRDRLKEYITKQSRFTTDNIDWNNFSKTDA